MPAFYGSEAGTFRQALAALANAGVTPQTTRSLGGSAGATTDTLREAILAEVPAFSASGNPEVRPGLERHAGEHVEEIRRIFAGGGIGDFDFVRAHARRCAEQRFPLEAVLHAYRCGHRVLSRWLRDAAVALNPQSVEQAVSAVADFTIEYTNTISTIATSEYVAYTRLLAEAEGDRRTELLNILLSGYDESDGRIAQLLKRAGYLEQRQCYCIVVAQSANASEMENPARAQRIVSAVSEAIAASPIRMLAGIRNNLVTAVLSAKRRQSGWTAAEEGIAERIHSILLSLGPAVIVGISTDHPSTSFLPKALHEATIALDFANVAKRVVQFTDLPIRDLLLHRGAEYMQSAPPGWVAAFGEADRKAAGALVQTLRAVADADMNVQKAARILGKHPNTVYTRIERIKDLTGLDGRHYHALTELLLAADCWRF